MKFRYHFESYQRNSYLQKQTGASVDTSKFAADATIITECKRIDQTDLVILIDGSWSVTPDNFVRVQAFLQVLLKHFTIGPDATLIGIAQYSDNPRLEFGLDRHRDTQDCVKIDLYESPVKILFTARFKYIDHYPLSVTSWSCFKNEIQRRKYCYWKSPDFCS